MESASEEHVQIEDDEAIETSSDCLGTAVILRKILENFSNTELLRELSLVNKQWNYEARCVIRDRANATVRLDSSGYLCQDLEAFVSDLRQMNVVPFTGMKITLKHGNSIHFQCPPWSTLDLIDSIILDRMPCKHFSVSFSNDWEKSKNCRAFLLIPKILKSSRGVLEEFSIDLEGKPEEFIQEVLQGCCFPRLKTLKVGRNVNDADKIHIDFIKALVSRAPNLEELHVGERLCFIKDLLEGSSALRVPLNDFNPLRRELSESVIPTLRPKRITLEAINPLSDPRRGFTVETFNRVMPTLLQVSRPTLNSVHMNSVFAVPLMCYGICLENVKELEISLGYRDLAAIQPRILTIMKDFDFTRIFPKLSKVQVSYCNRGYGRPSRVQIREFVEQGNAMLVEPLPDRAKNIKHLSLNESLTANKASFLAGMFPDIEKLGLKWGAYEKSQSQYELIWKNWVNLKELRVFMYMDQRTRFDNLDCVFCGIFPEEASYLREQDDDYLRAVNIVPVRPSITCLKDLRTLRCTFYRLGGPSTRNLTLRGNADSSFMFSKVTGLTAFARCPQLGVAFQANSGIFCAALRHMNPYMTVIRGIGPDHAEWSIR